VTTKTVHHFQDGIKALGDIDRLTLMMETLAQTRAIKSAPSEETSSYNLDGEEIRKDLFGWLNQLILPTSDSQTSWKHYVDDYSDPDQSQPEHILAHKVLFAMHLYTKGNQYLILIKDSTADDAAGVGIISVSVRFREEDLRIQKALSVVYGSSQRTQERLVNTIWIENFTQPDFIGALDRCALAILGNELIARRPVSQETNMRIESESADSTDEKTSDYLLLDMIKNLPEPARDEMISLLTAPVRQPVPEEPD